MAVPPFIVEANGVWKGNSLLNLPWLPPEQQVSESDSTLHVACDALKTFATVTYTWVYEGQTHEGTLLLAGSGESSSVELGWVDSWHQNGSVMHLVGETGPDATLKTKGSYYAEEQEWGWTIALRLSGNELELEMENVVPDYGAAWAVRGTYRRT